MKTTGYYYDIHMINTETKESRIYHDDYKREKKDDFYIWAEGNFSCDCNRSIFFYDYEEDKEMDCSKGRIVIEKIVIRGTGETVYSETGLSAIFETWGCG